MILDFDASARLAAFILLAAILFRLRQQGKRRSYLFCFALLWVYLLLVLKATLFPIYLPEGILAPMTRERVIFTLSHVNLIPFKYLNSFNLHFLHPNLLLQEIFQNVLLTVPLGFGIRFILPIKTRNILWLSLLTGFVLESAQLIISLGIGGPYRVVDITDLILNALGVLTGYGLFRGFAWLFIGLTERLGIEHSGISAYVYHIVNPGPDITEGSTPFRNS
jgi:glycopeptide antibiotics resistance protein